ncbi:hypothetical protein DUNSADRAFT_18622 [Dunaliella salina]|uniref:Encoded protein n=1 Tax=Dunaliella salina TaxID=3046 RepID=A0ABQ7FZR8_DUNSA|nr:hypothetical protein DUNSADRAFT_18622 [Dunaliella salina]|eukprot:KAF5827846.1 hypothetical protein DUNSADRAFT_18622 [Dunaliella salina]
MWYFQVPYFNNAWVFHIVSGKDQDQVCVLLCEGNAHPRVYPNSRTRQRPGHRFEVNPLVAARRAYIPGCVLPCTSGTKTAGAHLRSSTFAFWKTAYAVSPVEPKY